MVPCEAAAEGSCARWEELKGLEKLGIEEVTMVVACVSAIPRLHPSGWGTEGSDGATVKFNGAATLLLDKGSKKGMLLPG